MKALARMGVGLILAILTPGLAWTDEPPKAQFQTIKLKIEQAFDLSKPEFMDLLKGDEGWEVLLMSEHAILVRKVKDGPKWEYKAVKVKNSPFAIMGMKDVDAFGLIIDRMAGDGYTPCAVNGLADYTLYKRVKDAKPSKAEFQTLLWQDQLKSKEPPADRFTEKGFIEVLNKQGGEGWEVCVCNINAVVFQKSAAKWEYKTVKVTKSPLTPAFDIGGDKDDEAAAFALILEGLEQKGWTACASSSFGRNILVKRELKKDKKD
jgi:hypothetical protein